MMREELNLLSYSIFLTFTAAPFLLPGHLSLLPVYLDQGYLELVEKEEEE